MTVIFLAFPDLITDYGNGFVMLSSLLKKSSFSATFLVYVACLSKSEGLTFPNIFDRFYSNCSVDIDCRRLFLIIVAGYLK